MAIGLLPCAGTGTPLYGCCIASLQAMKQLRQGCRGMQVKVFSFIQDTLRLENQLTLTGCCHDGRRPP